MCDSFLWYVGQFIIQPQRKLGFRGQPKKKEIIIERVLSEILVLLNWNLGLGFLKTHTHTHTSFFIPFTQHTPNTRGRVQHSCDKTSPTHANVSQINTLRVCWFLLHLIICWRWKPGRVVPRAAVVRFWRCGNLKYHVFRVRRRRLWNVFAFSCRAGIYFLCEQHFRTSRKTYVNKINRKIFMV